MKVVRCPVVGLGVAVAAAVGFSASLLRVSAALLLDPTFPSPAFETGQFSSTQSARLLMQTGDRVLLFRPSQWIVEDKFVGPIVRLDPQGRVDPTFEPVTWLSSVLEAAVQPDGCIVVWGMRGPARGPRLFEVLRLLPDGQPDVSFQPYPANDLNLRALSIQTGGEILLAGASESAAGKSLPPLIRLRSNGLVDGSFTPPVLSPRTNVLTGSNGLWTAPEIQPDGSILIGGTFSAVNGVPRDGLARLLSDGTLDITFSPSGYLTFDGAPIRGIGVQSDGRIVAGGTLATSGTPNTIRPLLRFHPDGSLDPSFVLNAAAFSPPSDLLLLPDDRIVTAAANLERFFSDGRKDDGFVHPPLTDRDGFAVAGDYSLGLSSDGGLLVNGPFQAVSGIPFPGVVKLRTNGARDDLFLPGTFTEPAVPAGWAALPAGDLLAWGAFEKVNGVPRRAVARFDAEGNLDAGFDLALPETTSVESATVQPDGRVVLSGVADPGNGPAPFAVRLNQDNTNDPGFVPASTLRGRRVISMSDGRLLGTIPHAEDAQALVDNSEELLERYNADGVRDNSFGMGIEVSAVSRNPQTPLDVQLGRLGSLASVTVPRFEVLGQLDNTNVLVTFFDSSGHSRVFRLAGNGGAFELAALNMAMPPDRIQERFEVVNDPARGEVVQVPVYSLDSPAYHAMAAQPDSQVILAGNFTVPAGGRGYSGVIRLHPDGSVDTSFDPGAGPQWLTASSILVAPATVESALALGDGRLLLAGSFDAFDGIPADGVVALNANGSVDPSIEFGLALTWAPPANAGAIRLFQGPAARIHLAGEYLAVGEVRPRVLSRLSSPPAPPASIVNQPTDQLVAVGQSAQFTLTIQGTPPLVVSWDTSTDGINWTSRNVTVHSNSPATSMVVLSNVTAAQNGLRIRAGFFVGTNLVTSEVVTLRVASTLPASGFQMHALPGLSVTAVLGPVWTRGTNEAHVFAMSAPGAAPFSWLYRWDGQSWTLSESFPGYEAGQIFGTGALEVFATLRGGSDHLVLRSLDRGTRWITNTLPLNLTPARSGSLSGTPGNVHLLLEGDRILRHDGQSWSFVFADPANGVRALSVFDPAEGYYVTGSGWGPWNGAGWSFHGRQLNFADVRSTWGTRDPAGALHFYAVGNNALENGIRVWRFSETTQSFGTHDGAVLADGNLGGLGTATGIFGLSATNIFVTGERAATAGGQRQGRIYHFDGLGWYRLVQLEPLPIPAAISGRAPDNLWISLRDGRLLNLRPAQGPLAPAIVQHPQATTVLLGSDATFRASARGTMPLSYQWYRNGTNPIPGATGPVLHLAQVTPGQSGSYSLTAVNPYGIATSLPAVLTVIAPPLIINHPQSIVVDPPVSIVLGVQATGLGAIRYQWRRNGVNLPGATGPTLDYDVRLPDDAGAFSVVVANAAGAVTSQPAFVLPAPESPVSDSLADRVALPLAASSPLVRVGRNVDATREDGEPLHGDKPGGPSVWFRWTAPADGIARLWTRGSTIDSLLGVYTTALLPNLVLVGSSDDDDNFFGGSVEFNARSGQEYVIAIDGYAGDRGWFLLNGRFEATSDRLPRILEQPRNATVRPGQRVTLSVRADTIVLAQWFFNGRALANQSELDLVLPEVQPDQVGAYQALLISPTQRRVHSRLAVVEIGPEPAVQSLDKPQDLLVVPGVRLQSQLHAAPRRPADGASPGFISLSAGSILQHFLNNITNATTQTGEPNHCGDIGSASLWVFLEAANSGVMEINTEGSGRAVAVEVYRFNDLLATTPEFFVDCDYQTAPGIPSVVRYGVATGDRFMVAFDTTDADRGLFQYQSLIGLPPWGDGPQPTAFGLPPERHYLEGSSLSLTSPPQAGGSISYQWRRHGGDLLGQTNAVLNIANLQLTDSGLHSIVLSNAFGVLDVPVEDSRVDVPVEVVQTQVQPSGPQANLSVRGNYGERWVLQHAPTLEETGSTWTDVMAITNWLTGGIQIMSDATIGGANERFYRILVQP